MEKSFKDKEFIKPLINHPVSSSTDLFIPTGLEFLPLILLL
jgi:hypothetical protein